jgi:glycosyltransferase involved in cell wall biosynthesis
MESLMGYHRLLAYTKWGAGVIERSIGLDEAQRRRLDWLPHGIDFRLWEIRDKGEARKRFAPLVHEGDPLVGVIGTNQPRKDWGLMAAVCQRLLANNPNTRFWWHIDLPERHWSVPALLHDFSLRNATCVTNNMTNDELCWCYNACDITLHPGLGEGFGLPIAESLACGVPVVHGDYAGGADWLRQAGYGASSNTLVEEQGLRYDGLHNSIRPIYDPLMWADVIQANLAAEQDREKLRASVAHLAWKNLFDGVWSRWFEEGL